MAVHRHVDSPTPVDRVSSTQWVSASRKRADGAHACMGFSAHAAGVSGSAKFNQLVCPAGGRTDGPPSSQETTCLSVCNGGVAAAGRRGRRGLLAGREAIALADSQCGWCRTDEAAPQM